MLSGLMVLSGQELPLDGSQSNVLSFNPANDPLGDIDNYNLLQKSEVEGEWSKDDGRNETDKINELLTFNSILHIDVKLVGFEGDGNFGVRVSESQLLRYFETVLEEHEKEAMVINVRPGESHRLPIRRKFFFRVLNARKGLSDEISSRIRSWLLTATGVDASSQRRQQALRDGVAVPISMVDDLIRKDYVETELSGTHTIYLLNPTRVVLSGGNATVPRPRPVFKERGAAAPALEEEEVLAYWYAPPPDGKPARAAATATAGEGGCGTTMWMGLEERCAPPPPPRARAAAWLPWRDRRAAPWRTAPLRRSPTQDACGPSALAWGRSAGGGAACARGENARASGSRPGGDADAGAAGRSPGAPGWRQAARGPAETRAGYSGGAAGRGRGPGRAS